MGYNSQTSEPSDKSTNGIGVKFFNDLASFASAVQEISGTGFDFASLLNLTSNFIESTDNYLILNLKEESSEPNTMLFLTRSEALVYPEKKFSRESLKPFEKSLRRPFGLSTVVTFVTLDRIANNFKTFLDALVPQVKELEVKFDQAKYHELLHQYERSNERIEAFHDILLSLQERTYKEVETRLISFDYGVLIAETRYLQERCERRLSHLRELDRENELRSTTELNSRLERLNVVIRRLTALTVILMIPTIIAGHFGMNFAFMPELRVPWAYPAVIGAQIVITIAGIVIFKKMDWL